MITRLILSTLSTCTTLDEAERAVQAADRCVARMGYDSDAGDIYHASRCIAEAIKARMGGNIARAEELEGMAGHVLTMYGF